MWQMNVDPLGNIALSALVAAIPIFFLFWALAIKRMKGQYAAMGGTALAILIAVLVYKMPVELAALSTLYGGAFGLFPVCWIVITALFIYNMSVKTGQFEVIKNSLASISDDRRLQALLIAFSFGAFIEGAAGFGTPVAITAAMLAGLGFNPLYAACICLLANTAPVAQRFELQTEHRRRHQPAGNEHNGLLAGAGFEVMQAQTLAICEEPAAGRRGQAGETHRAAYQKRQEMAESHTRQGKVTVGLEME